MSWHSYNVQFNGGATFNVQCFKDTVVIRTLTEAVPMDEEAGDYIPLATGPAMIFRGVLRVLPVTNVKKPSVRNAPWSLGVLIELEDGEYMCVTDTIFSFTTSSTIQSVRGHMGNSAVPYFWARDKKGTYYMLSAANAIDGLPTLPRQAKGVVKASDPYLYFFAEKGNPEGTTHIEVQEWSQLDPKSHRHVIARGIPHVRKPEFM